MSNRLTMERLKILLSPFDESILDSLVVSTGKSKSAIVSAGIRALYESTKGLGWQTYLSSPETDTLPHELEEEDPEVLAARKRLMALKPVWED